MKQLLFSPGPVMVPEAVKKAIQHQDICHRVPAFEKIMRNVQNHLLQIYKANDDYTVLLITGSGTAANETVISSYFTPRDKVLVVNNGEFGGRLVELLAIHQVPAVELKYGWGDYPRISDLEKKLREEQDITAVLMVFHETSTSMINPVFQAGKLAHQYQKSFVVDGVSAVGGEDVDMVRDHIDLCTCSSNKCLASLPGVGIICARKSRLEATARIPPRIAYLNLHRLYHKSRESSQTPNTPSVTMFIALEAATRLILEEGLENQINRYRKCAEIIRSGVKNLGLKILLEGERAANTVTSVFLPDNISLEKFITAMENKGVTVYAGKGPLQKQNIFQIANMGTINPELCDKFLTIMGETLAEFGY